MRFEPAAGDDSAVAVLTLDDNIVSPGYPGYSTQQLDADLGEFRKEGCKRLVIRINSGGGDVQEAMAMYDTLKALKGFEVVAEIRGYCCSAATLVALACQRVTMTPNSSFMVHEPRGGCYGTISDWEAGLVHFRQLRDKILEIYATRTGKPVDEVERQMSATSWLTAQQALDGGWIDAIAGADAEPQEQQKEGSEGAGSGGAEAGGSGLSDSPCPAGGGDTGDPAPVKSSRGLLGWGRLKGLLGGGRLLHGQQEVGAPGCEAEMRAELVAQRASAEQARADLRAERELREEMVSREVARRLVSGGQCAAVLPRADAGTEGAPVGCAAEGWLALFQSV